MARVSVNFSSIDRFIKALDQHNGKHLKQEVAKWLDAGGMLFLDEIQREIIRLGVVDTRRLLASFNKGGAGNIWKVSDGGLTLEVGTNVEYAEAQNDGWDQKRRWVPGVWSGDSFTYQAGASTGMMLTEKRIEGRPYWDNALTIFERMFERSFDRKLEEWVNEMGGTY